MKRQTILLAALGALVLFSVSTVFMDDLLGDRRQALAQAGAELIALRQEAQAVQAREVRLAEEQQSLASLDARLLGAEPLTTIDRTVREKAQRSGVKVSQLLIEGPDPAPDSPGLKQYTVQVKLSGTRPQYLEFLRLLEEHPLLIELPEVSVQPQPGAQLDQDLTLTFFAR